MMRIEQERKIPSPPKNDTINFIFDSNWPSNNDKWNEKKIKNSATFRWNNGWVYTFAFLYFGRSV